MDVDLDLDSIVLMFLLIQGNELYIFFSFSGESIGHVLYFSMGWIEQ